jgi:hypothetical protein
MAIARSTHGSLAKTARLGWLKFLCAVHLDAYHPA